MKRNVLSLSIAAMIGGLQYASQAEAMFVNNPVIVSYASEQIHIDYPHYMKGVIHVQQSSQVLAEAWSDSRRSSTAYTSISGTSCFTVRSLGR